MRTAVGMGVLALLLLGAWLLWRGRDGASGIETKHIRIVPGTTTPGVDRRDHGPGQSIPAADRRDAPLPDLTDLSVNERSALLESRPRDPAWALPMERGLAGQLAGAMDGLTVQTVRCADSLCAVDAELRHGNDRQTAIDQLIAGRLNPAYARAGIAPVGLMSIEADDRGSLHFTRYLQRRR